MMMKRIALTLITIFAFMTTYAQSNTKTLVAYYTRTSNTETVANHIQSFIKADMFRVETVKSYPEGYHETTDIAKKEKNENARPEIKNRVENINQYDTIFIGFPIWWGTYPMAIATFIEQYDLSGKIIIPFCTHGGGGVDQGFKDIQKISPESTHKEGLSLNSNSINSSAGEIEKWLRRIGVIK